MNKKRCPWCGKIVNKETDARKYGKRYFFHILLFRGYHHTGVCSHCDNVYSSTTHTPIALSAYLTSEVLIVLGLCFSIWVLVWGGLAFLALSLLLSLFTVKFRQVHPVYTFLTLRNDKKLRVKMHILDQYYELRRGEVLLLFKDHDACEPFSRVSPISVSKLDEKAGVLEGYWLYDHCDNAYFASRDRVHLYDDDGNVVADITFKELL